MLFITHLLKDDGSKWEGPTIVALNWDDAETLAKELPVPEGFVKVLLVGEYIEQIDFDPEHNEEYH
jgi:hypothetical protein